MTDNKYISCFYEPTIPDFFEKVLPEINENRKEQKINICNRLKEVITFETTKKYFAMKFYTVIPFIQDNIQCNNITFVEDSENNLGFLEFKENLVTIPFYQGIDKPLLTDTYIQYEFDRFYPKLDSEGNLIGFDGYFAQKWNKYPDKVLVDEVQKIIIKENEMIVNGEVLPFEKTRNNIITPIYDSLRGTLEGFVIDKYCIHFPETKLDFSQNLHFMMFREVPPTFLKPTKVSVSLVKIEIIDQKKIIDWYLPKGPAFAKVVDEAFWRKYCINFPESSFESYHKYLNAKNDMINRYKANVEKHGEVFATLMGFLEEGLGKEKCDELFNKETEESDKEHC